MQKYGATFILMLMPKSDESFPYCPLFFFGGRNEQGFTLEFSFEKAREREKRGVRREHRNTERGRKKNTGYRKGRGR